MFQEQQTANQFISSDLLNFLKKVPFTPYRNSNLKIFSIVDTPGVRFDILFNPAPGVSIPYAVQKTTAQPQNSSGAHAVVTAFGLNASGQIELGSETFFSKPGVVSSKKELNLTEADKRLCEEFLKRMEQLNKQKPLR
jgi:hypothetical protein